MISSYVENSQQSYINAKESSKETWEELRHVYSVSGKGRLASMLQAYMSYVKGPNETIDQIALTIQRMVDDIKNLAIGTRPSEIFIATALMNACQGEEYAMAKHTLNQLDWTDLTPMRVIEQLRSVKHDIQTDAANAARFGRGGRPGLRGRGSGRGSSRGNSGNIGWKINMECYNCSQKKYLIAECTTKSTKDDDKNDDDTQKNKGKDKGKDKAAVATDDTHELQTEERV